MSTTVYQESVRRLELMICVIGLRVICSDLSIENAQLMLREYAITLRKLKIEFNYVGEDNATYNDYLKSEFVMGNNPRDIHYDPASGPSGINHFELARIETEFTNLTLAAEQSRKVIY